MTSATAELAGAAAAASPAGVLARFGHALADPTRAQLLLSLREAPGYPTDLADELGVSRQSLSNHLAHLRGCGLVVAAPEARRVRYALAAPELGHALDDLLSAVAVVDPLCPRLARTSPRARAEAPGEPRARVRPRPRRGGRGR